MNARSLWIDPVFGASGDMLLGALVGLGVPVEVITSGLAGLDVDGWTVAHSAVTRGGLSATRVEVAAADGPARHWTDIDAMLAAADLPEAVRAGARATFLRLGEVEAAQHDVPLDHVHFHEVGAVDAIVDIVGTWIALDHLGVIGSVGCGPIGLGHGTVVGAHGILPLPAPATAALLQGVPVRSIDATFETCTPTGAALLTTCATFGPMPSGTLLGTARGAGGKDPHGHPNVVSAHLIDLETSAVSPHDDDDGTDAVIVSSNVDDVTPELLAHVIERALAAGADDAWVTPIVMKKGRPAHQINVLCAPNDAAAMRALVSAETGTLGTRVAAATKFALERSFDDVDVDGHTVRIKVGPHGAKPEHDDVASAAKALGRPLREVSAAALARWRAPHT